ncbi:MAG: 2-C-methyl-D-erythritol 4-phosphate cytidylyltransferase [Ghiorsea sp.]
MKVGVLLLAAGSGKRFGSAIPKQYLEVASQPLIRHTLNSLSKEPRVSVVLPVIGERDIWFREATAGYTWGFDLLEPVIGGEERSISMQKGLDALPEDVDMVAVHDAARALPSAALLKAVLDMAELHGAAVPGLAVHDTIKRIDSAGQVLETPDRNMLKAVQTPQVAKKAWFEHALKREAGRLHLHTDDASVLEAAGYPVYISLGDVNNRKVTTPQDMEWLENQLQGAKKHED